MNTLVLLIVLFLPNGDVGVLAIPTDDCTATLTAALANESVLADVGKASHMDVQCLEAEGKPARDA